MIYFLDFVQIYIINIKVFLPSANEFRLILFIYMISCLYFSSELFLLDVVLDRNQLRNQLLAAPVNSNTPATLLLDTIIFLLQPELPWVCKIVGYFLERNAYALIRDITLTGKV